MLIEMTGYSGHPIFIEKAHILSINAKPQDPEITVILMAVGTASEEWQVRESVESLRVKIDNT